MRLPRHRMPPPKEIPPEILAAHDPGLEEANHRIDADPVFGPLDRERLRIGCKAADGEKFRGLFFSDLWTWYENREKACFGLLLMLYFYCEGDAGWMVHLLLRSSAFQRGMNAEEMAAKAIASAQANDRPVYDPNYRSGGKQEGCKVIRLRDLEWIAHWGWPNVPKDRRAIAATMKCDLRNIGRRVGIAELERFIRRSKFKRRDIWYLTPRGHELQVELCAESNRLHQNPLAPLAPRKPSAFPWLLPPDAPSSTPPSSQPSSTPGAVPSIILLDGSPSKLFESGLYRPGLRVIHGVLRAVAVPVPEGLQPVDAAVDWWMSVGWKLEQAQWDEERERKDEEERRAGRLPPKGKYASATVLLRWWFFNEGEHLLKRFRSEVEPDWVGRNEYRRWVQFYRVETVWGWIWANWTEYYAILTKRLDRLSTSGVMTVKQFDRNDALRRPVEYRLKVAVAAMVDLTHREVG